MIGQWDTQGLEKAQILVRACDPYNTLGNNAVHPDRQEFAKGILALLEYHKSPPDKTQLFEFGGGPHFSHVDCTIFNPALSHFFLLGDLFASYRVYNAHSVWRHLGDLIVDNERLTEVINSYGLDVSTFLKKMAPCFLSTFGAAQQSIDEVCENDQPAIVSTQTLNDPDVEREQPFWRLPGVHIHYSSFLEISSRIHRRDIGSIYADNIYTVEAKAHRLWEEFPERYEGAFQRVFGVSEPVDIFPYVARDWTWSRDENAWKECGNKEVQGLFFTWRSKKE